VNLIIKKIDTTKNGIRITRTLGCPVKKVMNEINNPKMGILNKLCQFKNSKISRTRKGIDK